MSDAFRRHGDDALTHPDAELVPAPVDLNALDLEVDANGRGCLFLAQEFVVRESEQ